ncbi:MAG: LysE family transporter [Bacteroidetes bacterium]|nr:LysE family transporter [Bacteroidota bacterium]
MISAVLEGILLGLTLAMLIGPAFFALLDTSLTNGFKIGVALAFGIFLSDLFCIILAYLGFLQFIDNPIYKMEIGIVGGFILVLFGLYNMLGKKTLKQSSAASSFGKSISVVVIKGFFLNLFNPFVILFWVGVVTLAGSRFESSKINAIVFFVASLITIFATDVVKCFVARKIKNYLNATVLLWVNRVSGLILVIFGLVLAIRVIAPNLFL